MQSQSLRVNASRVSKILVASLAAVCVSVGANLDAQNQNWGQSHSEQDLQAFIETNYAGRRISTSKIQRAARTRGWLATQADAKVFKQQLRSIARRIGPSTRFLSVPDPTLQPVKGKWRGSLAAAPEVEHNGSEGYANDIGTIFNFPTTVTGAISSVSDSDHYRFNVLLDGRLTVTTTSPGSVPGIQISNSNGDSIWGYHYWDSGNTTLDLPAGTYCIALTAGSATTYSMSLQFALGSMKTLAFGTPATTSLTSTGFDGSRVVLPQDGRLTLALTSNNVSDTYMIVQNEDWGFVIDSEDWDFGSGSVEAGLYGLLPKGTYYVYIAGDQTDTGTVTATFKAETIPTLDKTSVTGSLQYSDASYDIMKFVVTQTEEVTLTIRPNNGAAGITDTYAQILDSNMQSLAESWEDSGSWFSTFAFTLPPGTYYLSSSAYFSSGDYKADLSRANPSVTPVLAGENAISLATDKGVTLSFSLLTPSRVEVNLLEGGTIDCQMALMDANTGKVYAWEEDEYMGDESCQLGMVLPTGDYYIQVKEYAGSAGTASVNIMTPLHRFTGNIVGYQGHGGALLYFVVGIAQVPAYNPLAGIISGNLLISLAAPTVMVNAPLGATGKINFGASLTPGGGLLLQAVEIDLTTAKGFYTNLLK